MSDVLEFAGVGVRRGTTDLLSEVDWSVEEGERWVVIGPNGAGKTTLLQLASGRMHPTTGVAGVLGEVLGAVDVFELRPRIGVSSAAVADRIPDEERVSDVVVTAAYGVVGRWREQYDETDDMRAAELLEALGVAHLATRRFGTLSEGERKRVQIARALMTDPELMLLDEPAAGLDLRGREDLVGRLSLLAEDTEPVLAVTRANPRRWGRTIRHCMGDRTRHLSAQHHLVGVPDDPALALRGLDTTDLPAALVAAATHVLELTGLETPTQHHQRGRHT